MIYSLLGFWRVVCMCVGGGTTKYNSAGGGDETRCPGTDHRGRSASVGLVQAWSVRSAACRDCVPLPGACRRPRCYRGADWFWGEVVGHLWLQSCNVCGGVESRSEACRWPESASVFKLAPVGGKTRSRGIFLLSHGLNKPVGCKRL